LDRIYPPEADKLDFTPVPSPGATGQAGSFIFYFEEPCSKLQGIFDRKEVCYFQIRSLTPPQAAGNALAFAVHNFPDESDEE